MASMDDEQDAKTLSFSADFLNAEPLLISEVAILFEHRLDTTDENFGDVFGKTYEYVAQFGRYKDKEVVEEIRKALLRFSDKLAPFEIVQLGNLCPETEDEAVSLIPSLKDKVDTIDLNEVLAELAKYRKFAN
mmetsp:Transcript_8338/g.9294  ORF Transcript_8338/g.9294 Transcript_8338/m.9294 type:complete len:133 (+) Transcript_8338:570-968(+)|eukprot:CAMPEP_0168536824 /NCGR_PEP_ID=MMETSP0405-20121227/19854_1 /TAXON_ID=498012 /ORGANISM="Trichosphaerium sp, Strain Am-I-7 wt" /LENGTH=132 /DNA_ID=CAMNT_0008565053 /DNA_START=508 /DNA_END=906 /DNA_ORIENTATION=-